MTIPKEPQIITKNEDLKTLCDVLATQDRLAIDLEGDSLHHFREKLCLLQVTDENEDYIVDVLSITDFTPMKEILENPDILKVMHGADYDVVSLKRDYNCSINSLFDTALAAQFLNYDKFGLANLIERHFGFQLEKRYQKHDWSRRPLRWEHIDYARMDTHYLLALHEIMTLQLKRVGLFDACMEESTCLTRREWNGRQFDDLDFLRVKKATALSKDSKKALRALYEARDVWAENRDVPVFHFATDGVLFSIAKQLPTDKESLIESVNPKYKGLVLKKQNQLLGLVKSGLEDERPLPTLKTQSNKRPKNRWLNTVVNKLREWRTLQKESGVHDFLLPTNNQIKDLAFALPREMDELIELEVLRHWQIERWGSDVLTVITETVEPSP